ncbi:MAG: hypothetical protein ACOZQL_31825 [Myxococcota bacterium]
MERPKPGPSGSSSDDLELARALSRRLRGGAGAATQSAPGYASFGAQPPPPPLAAPIPAPAVATPVVPVIAPVVAAIAPPHAVSRPAPSAPRPSPPRPGSPRPTPAPPPPAMSAPKPVPAVSPAATLPLMTRREAIKAPEVGFGAEAWNKLLDACARATLAEAAFLMDPAGLIIGARGPKAGADLEGVGARLMVAFEQADQIDGTHSTLSMSVEMHRGTLHGVRLASDGAFLTLGLIIPGGLTAERQQRLLALLTASEKSHH